MCEMVTITVRKSDLTEKIFEKLLSYETSGAINYDDTYERFDGETWIEALERQKSFTNIYLDDETKAFFKMPENIIKDLETLNLSGTSRMDYQEFATLLKQLGIPVNIWFEECDGYNPTEILIKEDGTHVEYDVDKTEGGAFVPCSILHLMRHYPAEAFKTLTLELIGKRGFDNDKHPFQEDAFKCLQKQHVIAQIIGEMDEGVITAEEASQKIIEFKTGKSIPREELYTIVIDAEFSDGQAILLESESEEYVELHRSYDLYIGTYRGISREDAISKCSEAKGIDKSILRADKIEA